MSVREVHGPVKLLTATLLARITDDLVQADHSETWLSSIRFLAPQHELLLLIRLPGLSEQGRKRGPHDGLSVAHPCNIHLCIPHSRHEASVLPSRAWGLFPPSSHGSFLNSKSVCVPWMAEMNEALL